MAEPSALHNHTQKYGNKKRRGSKVSLRAYPCSQAFALPPNKDKQRKACPRQVIYTDTHHHPTRFLLYGYICKDSTPMRMEYTLFIYKGKVSGVGVIHIIILTADVSVASPLYLDSNLRSLTTQTVTFRKRPFETGRTTGLRSRSTKLFCHPPSPGQVYLGAKINIIFELPKIF